MPHFSQKSHDQRPDDEWLHIILAGAFAAAILIGVSKKDDDEPINTRATTVATSNAIEGPSSNLR